MSLDPSWIFFLLTTSGLGFIYFQYGRKNNRFDFLIAGLCLMVCAYFVHTATALGLLGLGLALAPFIYRKYLR